MKRQRIDRKARSRKGFTLVEMLCAMIVMLLATALATLAIDVSTSALSTHTREAEAQTLCSTLCTAICDELRMGKNFTADDAEAAEGSAFTYFSLSRKFGADCRIINDAETGRIMIEVPGEANPFDLVPDTAYTHRVKAKCDTLVYVPDTQTIEGTVSVYVGDSGSPRVLAQNSFTFQPMYK